MRIRRFLGCLLAVAGLVGCAAHTDDYRGGTIAAGTVVEGTVEHVGEDISADEHLTRLEGLELFEVGELLVWMPEMATNCYGPCPEWTAMSEAEQQAEIDAVRDAQEARLATLVAIAEEVHDEEVYRIDPSTVDEHLSALRRLGIVEVGEMVMTAAENNPYCYNLPCAEDIARADEDNALRAGEIAALALRASEEDI
jgi:hypothetical protein